MVWSDFGDIQWRWILPGTVFAADQPATLLSLPRQHSLVSGLDPTISRTVLMSAVKWRHRTWKYSHHSLCVLHSPSSPLCGVNNLSISFAPHVESQCRWCSRAHSARSWEASYQWPLAALRRVSSTSKARRLYHEVQAMQIHFAEPEFGISCPLLCGVVWWLQHRHHCRRCPQLPGSPSLENIWMILSVSRPRCIY